MADNIPSNRPIFKNEINFSAREKTCTKCGDMKSFDVFWKDGRTASGYSSQCKICLSVRRKNHPGMSKEGRKIRYNKEKAAANRIQVEEQTCSDCGETKDVQYFYRLCVSPTGYNTKCKKCVAAYGYSFYRKDETYRKKRIKYASEKNRLKKYGVGPEKFNQMMDDQKGLCAICDIKLDGSKFSLIGQLDHCHKTMKVRGILCSQCNVSLGAFKDNVSLLKSAIKYLEKNS